MDERGRPLGGAMVSALGAISALAVTDRDGAFALRSLPAGAYLVRAHLAGFASPTAQFVQVGPGGTARFSVTLQRIPGARRPAQRAGRRPRRRAASPPPAARRATGRGTPPTTTASRPGGCATSSAASSRSRAGGTLRRGRGAAGATATFSFVGRALGSSAQFFADLPLTAQVNFLTSGTFDGGQPRPGGRTGHAASPSSRSAAPPSARRLGRAGRWDQGHLGLVVLLAGSLPQARARAATCSTSACPTARSGSRPRPAGRSTSTARASARRARSTRSIAGPCRPYMTLDLRRPLRPLRLPRLAALFSPHVSLTVVPVARLRADRRGVAALAGAGGRGVPRAARRRPLGPARAHLHRVDADHARSAPVTTRCRSSTTCGGTSCWPFAPSSSRRATSRWRCSGRACAPARTGHYEVGNAGDVDAQGWSVGLSTSLFPRLPRVGRATASSTPAGLRDPAMDRGLLLVGAAARPASERLHDLTTSVETRHRPDGHERVRHLQAEQRLRPARGRRPPTGSRRAFDVQLMQGLPFLDFTSARWEVLVAVRDMFRDQSAPDASVYDELLVAARADPRGRRPAGQVLGIREAAGSRKGRREEAGRRWPAFFGPGRDSRFWRDVPSCWMRAAAARHLRRQVTVFRPVIMDRLCPSTGMPLAQQSSCSPWCLQPGARG